MLKVSFIGRSYVWLSKQQSTSDGDHGSEAASTSRGRDNWNVIFMNLIDIDSNIVSESLSHVGFSCGQKLDFFLA
jgi:hypothetical protein